MIGKMASENKIKKLAFIDKEKEVYTFEKKPTERQKKMSTRVT